ncbi:hypothetical protein [Duncaniella freteri]|jgi:hypothetical protein|uniref:hypothetical protein n=2 Tax=Duncaniella TaxID=2518495 RepID=UPI00256ED57D|nr:hypothetical protein [Duncaniella freteri]
MTQKEFEERTGLKTDAEEYAAIERMYMSAGSMGKDEFCKRWRQTGKNPLTMALADTATSLNEMLGECRHELIDMREKNIEHARFLLGKAHAYADTDFRREAVRLIGEREAVRLTMEEGYPLWDEDRAFILAIFEDTKG